LTAAIRPRRGVRPGRFRRFNSRSTRRPSPERKPGPSTDSQPSCRLELRRRPKATRQPASSLGPSGTNRLASSAAVSAAEANRRRDHHASGCHHRTPHTPPAINCHVGSPAARCASSWARIALRCLPANSAANEVGRTTVGRRTPKVTGADSPSASTTRTHRRIPSRSANAFTSPANSASHAVVRLRRNQSSIACDHTRRTTNASEPTSQVMPSHQ